LDQQRRHWSRTNFFESWRLLAEGAPDHELLQFDGILLVNSKLPTPLFNVAFVRQPLLDAEQAIERAIQQFRTSGVPGLLTFPPGVDPAAESVARGRGFEAAPPHPGMLMYPILDLAGTPDDVEIRTVGDEKALGDFLEAAEAGFGNSTPRILIGDHVVNHPAVDLFVGYVDGVAATTSALISTGRVAGIYWISTLKQYRGRGLGEALTAHAIRAGQARGCNTAALRASVMGRPIYERMGFSLSDDFISYVIPKPE
jgi:ribosomal protein S18 acetylase RimI-like enzyme